MITVHHTPTQLRKMVVGRLLAMALLLGALFFVPAGTLRYWEAWLYLSVLLIPMAVFTGYLLRHNPALLERRLKMREEQTQQRRIIGLSSGVLLAMFLIPGLDRRFGWSAVPAWLVITADVAILLSYLLFALTLRENEYAARTVEVQAGQRVISTGPYAFVRHPLYLAAALMFMLAPLALGSYWALLPAALFPLFLIARIRDEEALLRRELAGYRGYCQQVRYRLLPGLW